MPQDEPAFDGEGPGTSSLRFDPEADGAGLQPITSVVGPRDEVFGTEASEPIAARRIDRGLRLQIAPRVLLDTVFQIANEPLGRLVVRAFGIRCADELPSFECHPTPARSFRITTIRRTLPRFNDFRFVRQIRRQAAALPQVQNLARGSHWRWSRSATLPLSSRRCAPIWPGQAGVTGPHRRPSLSLDR
ncbi:hypothetical protein D3C86_1300660 [compost metagenome]